MTETPESLKSASVPPRYDDGPNRLGQALTWVGIVAGVLFIVAVVFFTGFFLGRSSGGSYRWHEDYGRGCYAGQTGPGGMMGPGSQGGMMGPGSRGGMMGPGSQGGMMGPGQMPPGYGSPNPTTSPSAPRP